MGTHRNEKINGLLQRELSLIILRKMKDDRILSSNLSITRVKAAPDLKTAVIYVSIVGDDKETILDLLNGAKGFLRSSLGQVITVHSVPALTFKLDDSVEYGMRIENLLKELRDSWDMKENDEEDF